MKPRILLIAAVVLTLVGLWQLASNARNAATRSAAIIASDQAGTDVTANITALTNYVHSHMHASIKFELTGSYQRATTAGSNPQPSGVIYSQAQAACASKADSITQAKCVTDYVSKHLLPATSPTPPPDPAKYTYDIHSPAWVPDLAGLSLLAAVVALVGAGWLYATRPRRYL